jgi:hypothetical protein
MSDSLTEARAETAGSAEHPGQPLPDTHEGSLDSNVDSKDVSEAGSAEARRRAAMILEVLAGILGPTEASQTLGVGVQHYYQLERRALRGLVQGCEPQPKGRRGPGLEEQLAAAQQELADCRRECLRQAALVRITQRAIGVSTTEAPAPRSDGAAKKPAGKVSRGRAATRSAKPTRSRRRRTPAVRALRAVQALRGEDSSGPGKLPVLERMPRKSTDMGSDLEPEMLDKEVPDANASR